MSKSYSKKKEELLILIKELQARFGDEFTMKLLKLNQHNAFNMYAGKIPVDATFAMIQRLPRDYENPEGIQRALKDSKVANIVKIALEDPKRYSSPNAIVLSLNTKKDYVKFENNPTDAEISYYKVDLNAFYKVIDEAEAAEDGYLIDETNKFVGTLIDAHHRTAGIFEAGKQDFECPVTVYIDLPKEEMYKVFTDINNYQEKPSSVHTLAMKAMSGTLSGIEELSHNITTLLNTEEWSILYHRIKDVDGKRPAGMTKPFVTNSTFEKLLVQQVLHHLPDEFNTLRKSQLLNDYFTAWSEVFDDAWNDDKTHVLVKSMGFQIMLRLFNVIYQRVSLSGTPTKEDFAKFIQEILKNSENFVVDQQELSMDWSSSHFGSYSSGKGINAITAALTKHITNEWYRAHKNMVSE